MKYELKKYNDFTYIQYIDEEHNLEFTNHEYFVFDVVCDKFKEIMSTTGGFTAEMTTRLIKKLNLRCNRIMLCQSPAKNNIFQFQFVYLSARNEVLNIEWDNNYYDYQYFKEKFSECTVEKGIIFDLLQFDYLKDVWKTFEIPSIEFNIKIDNREITSEDILINEDLCFLKDDYVEAFRKYGVTHAELTHHYDCFNASHFKARFIKDDGSYLLDWQGKYQKSTIEEFREEYGEEKSYDLEPFEASVATYIIRHLADHFTIKN
ncbi:MAG: hypothetical protein IJZ79_03595 [Bacilli bacterium]|nr:hypothetical protein [Bacilli bacterium]MBQ8218813.1 hypothetical protein [Bacilli bacterium]